MFRVERMAKTPIVLCMGLSSCLCFPPQALCSPRASPQKRAWRQPSAKLRNLEIATKFSHQNQPRKSWKSTVKISRKNPVWKPASKIRGENQPLKTWKGPWKPTAQRLEIASKISRSKSFEPPLRINTAQPRKSASQQVRSRPRCVTLTHLTSRHETENESRLRFT